MVNDKTIGTGTYTHAPALWSFYLPVNISIISLRLFSYFVIIAFLSLLRFAATRLYPVSLTVDIIAVRRPGRGQHHSVMIDITASSDPTVCIQIAMFIKMVPFPVNQLPAVGIEISVCKTIPPTVLILLPAASCPASVSINPVAIRG